MISKKNKLILISVSIIVLLFLSTFLFVTSAIFKTRGGALAEDGEHFALGTRLDYLHFDCPCDTEFGFAVKFSIYDPNGGHRGTFSRQWLWDAGHDVDYDWPIACSTGGINLDVRGTWTVEYELYGDGDWNELWCTDKGTFFVGDPTTCYKCQDGERITQDFYLDECPDGWTSDLIICDPIPEIAITCSMTISVYPTDSIVHIDGIPTTGIAKITAGKHLITVSRDGYLTQTSLVDIQSDGVLSFSLIKIADIYLAILVILIICISFFIYKKFIIKK